MAFEGPHGTNTYGELIAAPGVFIAHGAAFPSLPANYPTLTIMANADRIGRHVASRRPTR
jgi:choline dehydrogenase-like flavoprotein